MWICKNAILCCDFLFHFWTFEHIYFINKVYLVEWGREREKKSTQDNTYSTKWYGKGEEWQQQNNIIRMRINKSDCYERDNVYTHSNHWPNKLKTDSFLARKAFNCHVNRSIEREFMWMWKKIRFCFVLILVKITTFGVGFCLSSIVWFEHHYLRIISQAVITYERKVFALIRFRIQ